MALNNRIYKYTCDTCARSVERLADPTRPDPLRCVITDQCAGKLKLANTRFGLRPLNTPTVVGLLDRVKRGAPRGALATLTPLNKVNLSTFSSGNGLTLNIVQRAFVISGSVPQKLYYVNQGTTAHVLERTNGAAQQPSTLFVNALLFELTPAALEYKRYTYTRIERAVYVQGADNSSARASLSFDETSNVRVLVNGTLLDPTLYVKGINAITFTPELTAPSLLIEVFVYKSLLQFFGEAQAIKLSFKPLSPTDVQREAAVWGDVATVDQYTPLFCTDLAALDRSKTYGLVKLETVDENGTAVIIDPIGAFLLGAAPYAFQDKRLTAVVQLSAFTTGGFSIGFAVDPETGMTVPTVSGEALTPLARAMPVIKLDAIASSAGAAISLLTPRTEKTFILGPT